jgi:hypothetical protein
MNRLHLLLPLCLSVACDEQGDCGKAETCPVGTVIEEYREDREGFEVSGDAAGDVSEYEGGVAFRRFEQGSCEWACVAIQECPASTFPVITEDCFTCGTVNNDGDVVQGDCGD